MKFVSLQAFMDNPKLVWSWYNDRRKEILAANPNLGHIVIANLQNYRCVSVITQNIDGLHQLAGSRNVIELHGNIFDTKCTTCVIRFTKRSDIGLSISKEFHLLVDTFMAYQNELSSQMKKTLH